MRVSRAYAFDLIYKVGELVRRRIEELQEKGIKSLGQDAVCYSLREIQNRLSWRQITPSEAVCAVYELIEKSGSLVENDVKNLLRTLAV